MTTFLFVAVLMAGKTSMIIQSPFESMDQCKQAGNEFVSQVKAGAMEGWDLKYVDCARKSAI